MKRYLVFFGKNCCELGGMEDFLNDCDTLSECNEAMKKEILKHTNRHSGNKDTFIDEAWKIHWAQIYDTKTRQIIYEK